MKRRPATTDSIERHHVVEQAFAEARAVVAREVLDSRERSAALTYLDTAELWTKAALDAHHGGDVLAATAEGEVARSG